VLVQEFTLGGQRIETRLLMRHPDGVWAGYTYEWNDAQTDATLLLTGMVVPVTYTDDGGQTGSLDYRVPNQNQCFGCHGQRGSTNVLGVRTRQVNRSFDYGSGPENQIDHMAGLGMFDQTPPPAAQRSALADPYGSGPVEPRARAWLEANCSHCHQPGGAAGPTNLYLLSTVTAAIDYGVCRPPNAAGQGAGGRLFDIVAGHPEQSVMTYRVASTVPGIKMPEMPLQLVDQRGLELITQWIAAMPEMPCAGP
jgi:uncharacterized repeat protein (TIGR03806 family)